MPNVIVCNCSEDLSISHDTSQKKKPSIYVSLSFWHVCCANRSGSLHVARSCRWRRISFFLLRAICTVAATTAIFNQSQQEVCSIAQLQQMNIATILSSTEALLQALLDNDVAESVMQRCHIASVQNLGSNWQVSGGGRQ